MADDPAGGPPDPIDALGARLVLLGCLRWAARHEVPTGLEVADWDRLLDPLAPIERAVVALKAIRGLDGKRVSELFGRSRAWAGKVFARAVPKLREVAQRDYLPRAGKRQAPRGKNRTHGTLWLRFIRNLGGGRY